MKWFVPEIHSSAASRLLRPELSLSAPDLIVAEIGNIVWKKVLRKQITRAEADEVLASFDSVRLEVVPSLDLRRKALQLAVTLSRTFYDSLYLALAIARECALVTADRRFYSVVTASALGEYVRWVEDEL